jgi:hypothetical protein
VAQLSFGIVTRQYGFYSPNTSLLFAGNYGLLLSTASSEDSTYRQLVNRIPKVFFYFQYPAYKEDLLFKTRIAPFESYGSNHNGLTHLMSYRISLGALVKDVTAYTFGDVKGNYYVRPITSRRSNFYVNNSATNVTFNLLATNMTYIGGMTTCGIIDTIPVNTSIDFIEFELRDIDLVFTTLFKL